MRKFIEKQYQREKIYIWNKYFGGKIHIVSDMKPVENAPVEVCEAEISGRKYNVYRNHIDGLTLIPTELTDLADDFDPIIQYSQNIFGNPGFSFSLVERKDGTVEKKMYTFSIATDDLGETQMLCQFGTFDDKDNDLQRNFISSGKTLPHFVASNGIHSSTKDPNQLTVKVKREPQSTRWNKGIYNLESMTEESLEDYFSFPYTARSNVSMIKLAESIHQHELETQTAKVNKKA